MSIINRRLFLKKSFSLPFLALLATGFTPVVRLEKRIFSMPANFPVVSAQTAHISFT